MIIKTSQNSIKISEKAVQKIGGMVILPLKEYKRLCDRAIPTYQFKGKEAEELDKLVEEGVKEYKAGKCKKIKSLADID